MPHQSSRPKLLRLHRPTHFGRVPFSNGGVVARRGILVEAHEALFTPGGKIVEVISDGSLVEGVDRVKPTVAIVVGGDRYAMAG